jgi:hypothetical protein
VGIDLGHPDEATEVPKNEVKAKVCQAVTLVADGFVAPRGQAETAGDIDAAAWLFDEAFKLVPAEKAKGDKTKSVFALTPLKAGTTRVRLVGDTVGRYYKFDVVVEVGK